MNRRIKNYIEFLNESVGTFVPYDIIELIKNDINRSKKFIQTKVKSLRELAIYLTSITKKYDVVFHTYEDYPGFKGSPAFVDSNNIVNILLQPDEIELITNDSKWGDWINRLEDSLVHEMTHQQDMISSKAKYLKTSNVENKDEYFGSPEEIRAYANEQMNKFKRYGWDKEYIESILQNGMTLKCKGCKIWNYYVNNYKGTETFEWFLKCCYEYLDKYIK